jgi:hypothetical protein
MKQTRDASLEQSLALRACPNFAQLLDSSLGSEARFGCMLSIRQDVGRQRIGRPVRCKVFYGGACKILRKLFPGEFDG